jgi:molybdate transport system substrate-binding protein
VKVNVTTGASGTLTAQILKGAPFDLLMAADLEYPRQLVKGGYAGSEVIVYGRGRLVLWSMKPGIDVSRGLSVLGDAPVARIAIANPAHAPYGRAAKAALVKADVWQEIERKIVLGENVAQTAQFIETRHVDAGLVALSVIRGARRDGSYFELPLDSYPRMDQGAVLTKRGAQNDEARAFLAFLQTQQARATLKEHGFEILP